MYNVYLQMIDFDFNDGGHARDGDIDTDRSWCRWNGTVWFKLQVKEKKNPKLESY